MRGCVRCPPTCRWHIENTAFYQFADYWHFTHVFTHGGNALSSLLWIFFLAFNLLQIFLYRQFGGYGRERGKDPTRTILRLVEEFKSDLARLLEPSPRTRADRREAVAREPAALTSRLASPSGPNRVTAATQPILEQLVATRAPQGAGPRSPPAAREIRSGPGAGGCARRLADHLLRSLVA